MNLHNNILLKNLDDYHETVKSTPTDKKQEKNRKTLTWAFFKHVKNTQLQYNEKKHYHLISIRSIDMFICTLCTENNYASTKLKNHNEHAWRLHKIGRTTPGVVKRIFSTSLFF